jgi:Cu2+-exporting ATPase
MAAHSQRHHGSDDEQHATRAGRPGGARHGAGEAHGARGDGVGAHAGHAGHARHGAAAEHAGHAAQGGHDKHAGHSVEMFRSRFWISLALTIPILAFGHMVPDLLGAAPLRFPGSRFVAPALGTVLFFYGGWVFVEGAARELRARLPGMMTLIALAIGVAFAFSVAVTLGFPGMPLWEELATLITIMILGHWLEMRSIGQASGALRALAKLLPATATRVTAGGVEEIPAAEVREGDLLLVRPGERVPADGVVREGTSAVNESLLTGESRPVSKSAGDRVIAGAVNGAGSLRFEVTGTGERTALSGIMRLVEQAQASRSRAQALADRAARWLTWIALGAGAVTLAAWLAAGATGSEAVERAVTVLVIACPHALGLAVPLVVAISTTLGAQGGLLVRDRRGLEEARKLDTVVFDKTGTLTRGEFGVVALAPADGVAAEEALRLAAAVEQDSEHPIAEGIVRTARERGIDVPGARGFAAIAGVGARAEVEGRRLAIGGPALLRSLRLELPARLAGAVDEASAAGRASIVLVEEGASPRPLAVLAVADVVRPESREAI